MTWCNYIWWCQTPAFCHSFRNSLFDVLIDMNKDSFKMRQFRNPNFKNTQDFCVWICHHWDFSGSADWIFLVCFHFLQPRNKKETMDLTIFDIFGQPSIKTSHLPISLCSTVFLVFYTNMKGIFLVIAELFLFFVSFRKGLFLFIFPWSLGSCWTTSWWMDKVLGGPFYVETESTHSVEDSVKRHGKSFQAWIT